MADWQRRRRNLQYVFLRLRWDFIWRKLRQIWSRLVWWLWRKQIWNFLQWWTYNSKHHGDRQKAGPYEVIKKNGLWTDVSGMIGNNNYLNIPITDNYYIDALGIQVGIDLIKQHLMLAVPFIKTKGGKLLKSSFHEVRRTAVRATAPVSIWLYTCLSDASSGGYWGMRTRGREQAVSCNCSCG